MNPLIGITAARRVEGTRAPAFFGARESYLESIIAAGGVPVILPLTQDMSIVRQLYEHCAGILLPGGEDVNPSRYGQATDPNVTDICDLRDEVEIHVARWADDDNKPLLGICRGIQLMNVAMGGNLYQDIPSQVGSGLHKERKVTDSWRALVHSIKLTEGTHLHSIFGMDEIKVNSLHHQAVRDIAPGLVVSALAADGIIEGLEDPNKNFFIGVQPHPELLWQALEPRWLQLFKSFVAAARSWRKEPIFASWLAFFRTIREHAAALTKKNYS